MEWFIMIITIVFIMFISCYLADEMDAKYKGLGNMWIVFGYALSVFVIISTVLAMK